MMWRWFKSLDRSNKLLIIFGALVALIMVVDALDVGESSSSPSSMVRASEAADMTVNDFATSARDTSVAQTRAGPSTALPPTAVVDGVSYNGQQQIEAMTQAARDAGMDEATARRTGEEAAALCNGNPECLK